jgi:hypothetical protein
MAASCFSNRARRIHKYRGLCTPEEVITPPAEFFFCSGGFPLVGGRFVLSPLDEDLLFKTQNDRSKYDTTFKEFNCEEQIFMSLDT